ncbi:MFS transporter [Algihabitans albus]|uniref:MFS transporter n=1 Tax=Algihabitans albus TaxID=2164067 RepID=UPI000E5D0461|nr:MFS transporter [Algihabitans albus]
MVLAALAVLTAAQYLALFFFYGAVPAILRQSGASLELLGFFGLAYGAFALSFLWAPYVDRLQFTRLGRRRTWILAMQFLALAFVGLALRLDPAEDALALLIVAFAVSFAAATQRIATLGYAVESLAPQRRAWGSTAIGWGGAIGLLLGGSAMLIVVERFGWSTACLILIVVIATLLLLLPLLREPSAAANEDSPRASLAELLRRPETRRVLAVALPLSFAKGLSFTLMQPRLVDLGVGLSEIALAVGLANAAGFMIVGPAVSLALTRLSLATAFRWMAASSTAALSLIALIEFTGHPTVALAVSSVVLLFAAFTVMQVVITTLFMTLSDRMQGGTDLTTFLALFALGALPGTVAGGFIAGSFGYGAGFAVGALSCFCGFVISRLLPLALRLSRETDPAIETYR